MRAILIADIHLTQKTPRMRNEVDFLGSQLEVLNRLFKIAEEKQCNIYCGGDVFDKWNDMSSDNITRVIQVFDSYPKIKFITCLGNHDIPAGNLNQYSDKSLCYIVSRACQNFQINNDFSWKSDGWIKFMNKSLAEDSYSAIECLHAAVGVDGTPGSEIVDDWDNCLETAPEIFIIGDQHEGWGVKEFRTKSGKLTYFINPGSFTKLKINEQNQRCDFCYAEKKNNQWHFDLSPLPWDEYKFNEPAVKLLELVEKTEVKVDDLVFGQELIENVAQKTQCSIPAKLRLLNLVKDFQLGT